MTAHTASHRYISHDVQHPTTRVACPLTDLLRWPARLWGRGRGRSSQRRLQGRRRRRIRQVRVQRVGVVADGRCRLEAQRVQRRQAGSGDERGGLC